MEIIKVSSTSVPNHVAGAIASLMREQDKLMIQTIGAAALNQAIKSIAIARDIHLSVSVERLFTKLSIVLRVFVVSIK